MLDGLLKFIEKIKRWVAQEEVAEELRLDSKEIVNMVKLQLARGIDGNGNPVYLTRNGQRVFDYSPRTKRNKKDILGNNLGSITDVITNYMSGRFYNSIRVQVFDDATFQVYSVSPLYDIIKYRSGDDIINLSPESERYLFEHEVAPDLQEEINRLYFS